jgi:hypothetical protein
MNREKSLPTRYKAMHLYMRKHCIGMATYRQLVAARQLWESFGTHSHYDRASSTRDSSIAQQIHHRDTTNEITHALASMAQPLVPTANPTDPTAALPSELSTKIFKLVALHSSADLAACRLVSSAQRQHSDPFLITAAVVAERPKALQKLDELLAHPYFRTQIKTLVWDASTYNEYLATSYDDYKRRFGTAPHLKKYEIVRSDPTLLPRRPNRSAKPQPPRPRVLRLH